MGNFAENLNLGNRFRPPLLIKTSESTPSFGSLSIAYSGRIIKRKKKSRGGR